jgi:AcrR family transcriptional regulator
MTDTKQKILDAAERLIAEQGYAATSLRQIIAEAGVNLASVHYHFGSKEELLDELVARKVKPVNEKRLEMLEHVTAEATPGKPSVEKVLEAFMVPMAQVASRNPQFVKVMGRIQAEGLRESIAAKHFKPVSSKFIAELRTALPELPDEEFQWRVQFLIGATIHTMCGCTGAGHVFDERIAYLIHFLAAGFYAPSGRKVEVPA